jgi:dihydrofolate reductase
MIVAVDQQGGFAKGGEIPWNYKEDWEHFKATTKGAICIMGRRTYQDIWDRKPANTKAKKTLPGRDCYVVTSNTDRDAFKGVEGIGPSLRTIVDKLPDDDRPIFILGGEKLYIQAIVWAKMVHVTLVPKVHGCDRFFPVTYLDHYFEITEGRKGEDGLLFATYSRKTRQQRSNETKRTGRGQNFNAKA